MYRSSWRFSHEESDFPRLDATTVHEKEFREFRGHRPERRIVDRNASHGGVFLPAKDIKGRFEPVSTAEFSKEHSAWSRRFSRRRPAPGFDRLTANRTNYELGRAGEGKVKEWESTYSRTVRENGGWELEAARNDIVARHDEPEPSDLSTWRPLSYGTYHPSGERKSDDHGVESTVRTAQFDHITGQLKPRIPPRGSRSFALLEKEAVSILERREAKAALAKSLASTTSSFSTSTLPPLRHTTTLPRHSSTSASTSLLPPHTEVRRKGTIAIENATIRAATLASRATLSASSSLSSSTSALPPPSSSTLRTSASHSALPPVRAPLATLAAVRPPTPKGTDFYKGFLR